MTTRTFTVAGSLAGKNFTGSFRREGSSETNAETATPLAAGVAATLTTRTDNDTGVITLPAGHGIVTGKVDVFWGGATPGCRWGMDGVVTVNSLAIDGGTGENLPIATTALVVDNPVTLDLDSESTTIVLAAVSQQRRAGVQFQQDAGTPILSLDLGRWGNDGEPYLWAADTSVSIPFGADVSKVLVSNGSSGGTNNVTVGILRS